MRDDAIAPVIAVMLILAAIVTFFSIWNAIYVPSMKESSEVEHLQNVESAFEHFSSDIDYAASTHQNNLVFNEPVQLGGGDVLVNPLKSSGSLYVQNENNPIYILNLTDGDGNSVALLNGSMVNFSYQPENNFWQDQGYQWQYGYINVTKYYEGFHGAPLLNVPLDYSNMGAVNSAFTENGSLLILAQSFGSVSPTVNTTPVNDISLGGNCSALDLWAVSLSASPSHTMTSSNGFGNLGITSTVTEIQNNTVSKIMFISDNEPFGKGTVDYWNSSFSIINTTSCPENLWFNPNDYSWNIRQEISPVTVNLHEINIEISAS